MDNEKLAGNEAAAGIDDEDEGREYDLEGMDTEDLDDAMREALEAVERSEEHLEEASRDAPRDAGEEADVGEGAEGGDLAVLQAELAELRDRSVRTLADFDNYRKRVARERREERRYATADLVQDILAVVDNLERAIESEGSAEDLKQGVEMINQQLQAVLGRHGIERVEALGEPFDPALHEAVMRVEDAEVSQPMVREQMQSGYRLHDRLLRPAMVTVAVPAVGAAGGAEAEEPAED